MFLHYVAHTSTEQKPFGIWPTFTDLTVTVTIQTAVKRYGDINK